LLTLLQRSRKGSVLISVQSYNHQIKMIDKNQNEPMFIQNPDDADYEQIVRINIQDFQHFRAAIGRKAQDLGLTEDKLIELLSNE
jgi:hypothetical protein